MSSATRPSVLRPFMASHLALLARWLAEAHVARWYRDPDGILAWARTPPPGGSQAIIAWESREVGYLRWQRVSRATLDSLGLPEIPANSVDADILIGGEGDVGHGVGPDALGELVATLRRDPDVPMIGLTTERANTRAHRAFEKAGFRIARQYDAPGLGLCHLMLLDLRIGRAGGRSSPALDAAGASAARERDDAMASGADAVIRAWFEELWNQGREDTIDRLLAPGAQVDGLPTPIRGPEGFRPFYRTFRAAFPDIRVAVERTITEGDLVAAHCCVTGRRAADPRRATGTAVEFWGMCIARVQDGKIVEAWNSFDFLALYQQLGLMPSAPAL